MCVKLKRVTNKKNKLIFPDFGHNGGCRFVRFYNQVHHKIKLHLCVFKFDDAIFIVEYNENLGKIECNDKHNNMHHQQQRTTQF